MKWQYKVVDLDYESKKGFLSNADRELLLNSLGAEGWELVSVASAGGGASEYTDEDSWTVSTAYLKKAISV